MGVIRNAYKNWVGGRQGREITWETQVEMWK